MAIRVNNYGRGEMHLKSPTYSPALRRIASETPGMTWIASAQAWSGYVDAVDICCKRLDEENLYLDDADMPKVDAKISTTAIVATKGMRDYQVEGVSFCIANAETGVLLADEMGLGKTIQALRAVRALKAKTVVVCPAFVKNGWVAEAKLWWKNAKTVILKGTKPAPIDAAVDVVILNYDIAHGWADTLIAWGAQALIIDEAHYLMSDKARRSVAVRSIARRVKYRIALTGTPMTSRPRDLWNVLDTISEGRFGKAFKFYLRHCDAHREKVSRDKTVWKFDGSSNLEELQRRLKWLMLRRTKADVRLELPARTRQVLDVDIHKGNIISPAVALSNDAQLQRALDLAADGKIPQVVELVASHVSGSHKVVVFTHRRSMAEAICDQLIASGVDAAFVHGGLPQAKRDEAIAARHDVLVATLDSVGVGINTLVYADVGVFAELDWVPSKLAQGEARLHRSGQQNSVLIQYVIALGTVDEIIRDACINKLDVFMSAVGKLDDALRDDLKGAKTKGAAAGLKSLYEKLKKSKPLADDGALYDER